MTDTYKVLGQVKTVGSNSYDNAYTVPSGREAAVSTVQVVNTGVASSSYSLFAVPFNETKITVPSVPAIPASPSSYSASLLDTLGVSLEQSDRVVMSDDGSTLLIGQPNASTVNGSNSGRAIVYSWNSGSWTQKGSTINGIASEYLGGAIDISNDGNTVVVSSRNASSVRVFDWNGSSWAQRGSTISVGSVSFDSVAISPTTNHLVLGDAGYDSKGAIQLRYWNGSSWAIQSLAGQNFAVSSTNWDSFGASISWRGNWVAVGAPGANSNNGLVRLYYFDGVTMTLSSTLNFSNGITRFGGKVVFSADSTHLAVGTDSMSGFVVYYRNPETGEVTQKGSFITKTNLNFVGFGNNLDINSDGSAVLTSATFWSSLPTGPPTYSQGTREYSTIELYGWDGSDYVLKSETKDFNVTTLNPLVSMMSTTTSGSRFTSAQASSIQTYSISYTAPTPEIPEVPAYEITATPSSKHCLIKNKSIAVGEHHSVSGGIQLSEGDIIYIQGSDNNIVVNLHGVEIS